jgi:hypothetical protein|tara:strand:+ start:6450 stop:6830 length:381 start_codon:yes stop_codon:yes gene_type:complete
MSFQWIFDNAESISIDRKQQVAQTITRNNTVRAISRGNGVDKFTVKMPDGMRWSEVATYIQAAEALNRFTPETVDLNEANMAVWLHNGGILATDTWTVICVEFPEWTIFARDQVSWSGAFVFYEVA